MTPQPVHRSHQEAADSFIARAVAIFVVAMAAQSAGGVIAQSPGAALWWLVAVGSLLAVSGCWVTVSGLLGRNHRPALTTFAVAAVVGLASWPAAYPVPQSGPPWVWNVLGLSVACVAAAWGYRWALPYVGVTAVVFDMVRLLPSGGAAGWATSLQDSAFLVASGLALTAAIQAVRMGAVRADASAAAAASAHHRSAVARARLIERNRLGALLHDSVLNALVAAAQARTPAERRAVAALAATSLRRIEDYGLDRAAQTVHLAQVPERLRSTAESAALLPVEIYASFATDIQIPGEIAEALLAAVHAAVDNASRHSGASGITIRLSLDPPVGNSPSRRLRIEVSDDGRGFDPQTVPSRCLGVRLSIIQRMRDAGGSAVIDSAPGRGTRVVLESAVPG
ncbi:MAG: ATP-binding protein [Microlunatus sp.]